MKIETFNLIINHLWEHREYYNSASEFDYPFYGGLKRQVYNCSTDSIDAMQNIWSDLVEGKFKTKITFSIAYKKQLNRYNEKVSTPPSLKINSKKRHGIIDGAVYSNGRLIGLVG